MKQITMDQWKRTPRDYKSIINGQRFVLEMTNKGTCLVPVEVVKAPQRKAAGGK